MSVAFLCCEVACEVASLPCTCAQRRTMASDNGVRKRLESQLFSTTKIARRAPPFTGGALKRQRLKALLLVEKGLASSIVEEKLWLRAV